MFVPWFFVASGIFVNMKTNLNMFSVQASPMPTPSNLSAKTPREYKFQDPYAKIIRTSWTFIYSLHSLSKTSPLTHAPFEQTWASHYHFTGGIGISTIFIP